MPGVIAVYGARGSLGQLVTQELVRRDARVRAAGRDARRLERTPGLQGPGIEHVAAQVQNRETLHTLLQGTRVLVNVANLSPTDRDRLVAAAVGAGVHYVDASGEQAHISRLVAQRHDAAATRKIAILPACGFDYALGDCLAAVVARNAQPAQEVVVAYAVAGADVSANSLQFAAETEAGAEVLFEDGRWIPARLEILRRRIEFPQPFGWQVMARYAAGEVLTVPRHVDTQRVTTLITASSLVPDPRLVPLFPYVRPAIALLRRTPARRLLRLVARLKRRASSETLGRTEAAAAAPDPPHFAIVVEVTSSAGQKHRGVVTGKDFHAVTAATLGFAAAHIASPSFRGVGVLAPAAAFDAEALLDDLGRLEVRWNVGHARSSVS